MARNRKSAYGAPQEGKEVVVTVDKRLMYGLGLVLAFIVAIGAGMAWTQLQESSTGQRGAAPVVMSSTEGLGQLGLTDADMMATAMADNMPTTVVIVTPMGGLPGGTPEPGLGVSGPGVTGGLGDPDPDATVKARITPVSEMHGDLLEDPSTRAFEIGEDFKNTAADWPPDVLANFEDPNVTDPNYAPLRLEIAEGPYDGPRLAIGDLNELMTYNFGVIAINKPALHEFEARNVGDEDLLISRVYSACGCTATTIGDIVIDPAGFIQPDGLVLRPGESVRFGVEFDPRAEGTRGSQAKYVQVFSNDPTGALFDANDPNTHETRFRLVVDPE